MSTQLPSHYQAWHCQGYGLQYPLVRQSLPMPLPQKGQLLVRVLHSSISAADLRIRLCNFPKGMGQIARLAFGWQRPRNSVLGIDMAAEVVAVGEGVSPWRPGERLLAATGMQMGGHGQYALLNIKQALCPLPQQADAAQSLALIFGGQTALTFLEAAKAKAGQKLLLLGAGGAVGSSLLKLAQHQGLVVTAVASSRKTELMQQLAVSRLLAYDQVDWQSQLRQQGETFDLIADCCGLLSLKQALPLLSKHGQLLAIAGGLPDMLQRPIGGRKVVTAVAADTGQRMAQLLALHQQGTLQAIIDSRWDWSQLDLAFAEAAQGHKTGCMIIDHGPAQA